ncbi:hypothetical protein BDN67DRAFT_1018178 [Paxillus ammoniavirescens]|nr:hypothetical protein BDN67DRAFT_1018178 [Paxillus ammoniavirescens]
MAMAVFGDGPTKWQPLCCALNGDGQRASAGHQPTPTGPNVGVMKPDLKPSAEFKETAT